MHYSHLCSNYGCDSNSVYIFELTGYSILSVFQGVDVILFYARKRVMTYIDAFTQRIIIVMGKHNCLRFSFTIIEIGGTYTNNC